MLPCGSIATLGTIVVATELVLDSISVAVCQAPPEKRLASTLFVVPLACTNTTVAWPASLIAPTGLLAAPLAFSIASAAVPIQAPAAYRRARMLLAFTQVTRPLPLALRLRLGALALVPRVVAVALQAPPV